MKFQLISQGVCCCWVKRKIAFLSPPSRISFSSFPFLLLFYPVFFFLLFFSCPTLMFPPCFSLVMLLSSRPRPVPTALPAAPPPSVHRPSPVQSEPPRAVLDHERPSGTPSGPICSLNTETLIMSQRYQLCSSRRLMANGIEHEKPSPVHSEALDRTRKHQHPVRSTHDS